MAARLDLLTATEASAICGVPLRAVYKVARERLPRHAVVHKSGKVYLTRAGAVCARLDRELPRDVPAKVRRALYRMVELPRKGRIEYGAGSFRYVLDTAPAAKAVARELAAYRRALNAVAEHPDIQGGAATFRGTRLLVHHIADLLSQGASADELKADYPNLTDAMLAAAPIYARAHPRRGRPKRPAWQKAVLKSERRIKRAQA
jgi:uncharacterized protein (DUF433 family)